MAKPELSEWHVWESSGIYRWIRTEAVDSDSIAMTLRRKWKAPAVPWWRVEVHTPDQRVINVGYIDDLDEAKAAADREWADWDDWHSRVRSEMAEIVEPGEWTITEEGDLRRPEVDVEEGPGWLCMGGRIRLEWGCVSFEADSRGTFGEDARRLLAAVAAWEIQ